PAARGLASVGEQRDPQRLRICHGTPLFSDSPTALRFRRDHGPTYGLTATVTAQEGACTVKDDLSAEPYHSVSRLGANVELFLMASSPSTSCEVSLTEQSSV